jgi:hypothetical protein
LLQIHEHARGTIRSGDNSIDEIRARQMKVFLRNGLALMRKQPIRVSA